MGSYRPITYLLFLISLTLLFLSCTEKGKEVTRSYYFWKNYGAPGNEERKFLKKHRIRKLYAKLMDIDWNEVYGAYPVSSGNLSGLNHHLKVYDSLDVTIVPVVFITNKTFLNIDSAAVPLLAKRVLRRCLPAYDSTYRTYKIWSEHHWWRRDTSYNLREIQFDCDWTPASAKKYFYFLQQVRSLLPGSIILSATIRLHQYKYPSKTGVPPVHRGMLMVYNISDLRQYSPLNSIFDYDKASAYFTAKKYPLPLDIALPAYSWCIIFRNRQFYQIENGLSQQDLHQCTFLQQTGKNFYRVKQDTVFRELFLRPGDEIKVESIDAKTLEQAALLSRKAVNTSPFSVALFELSASEIKNYSHETIEEVYGSYR